MRWAGVSSRSSNRSKLNAKCEPRFVPATACTSSTITVSTDARIERAFEVSIKYSDSGVVTRISGGWETMARRSFAVVSPLRVATLTCGACAPNRSYSSRIPASGVSRFLATSTPSAFSGEIYSTRTPFLRAPARFPLASVRTVSFACDISLSMAYRNADSVLPEPVGEMTSTLLPFLMAGHASVCACVGVPNTRVNQARVGSLNIAILSHICSIMFAFPNEIKSPRAAARHISPSRKSYVMHRTSA